MMSYRILWSGVEHGKKTDKSDLSTDDERDSDSSNYFSDLDVLE